MASKFALFTKGSKLPLNKGFKNMFEFLQSCAQPSKCKYFVLIDHILSDTICHFCFCVLFPKRYQKIKLTAKKIALTYAISIVFILLFLNLCLRKYFLLFFAEFELLLYFESFSKSKK